MLMVHYYQSLSLEQRDRLAELASEPGPIPILEDPVVLAIGSWQGCYAGVIGDIYVSYYHADRVFTRGRLALPEYNDWLEERRSILITRLGKLRSQSLGYQWSAELVAFKARGSQSDPGGRSRILDYCKSSREVDVIIRQKERELKELIDEINRVRGGPSLQTDSSEGVEGQNSRLGEGSQ